MKAWRKQWTKLSLIAVMLFTSILGLTQVSALGNDVEIILEVDKFNAGFKDGIFINGTQVYVNSTTILGFATLKVPVTSAQLVNGVNTVTVTSGNDVSPTGTAGNNDDFEVRNVRLKIAEGTIYQAESAKVFNANGTTVTTTPSKTDPIALGDGNFNNATAKEKAEFKFTLGTSQLIMEVHGFADGFKNGVYLNGTTLKVFDEEVVDYATVTVNVPNRLIMKGNNVITVTSGNQTSATGTAGNNDDFNMRDVRLKLADNKILRITTAKFYNGDGTTTTVNAPANTDLLHLGDGNPPVELTAKQKVDFTFNLIDYDFTFALLPDTQNYTRLGNEAIFGEQTKWLVNKQEEKNLKYVLSVGDIINNWDVIDQWEVASAAYQKLDNANIPYGVVAGNHDVNFANGNYTNFGTYFGSARYSGKPWYGGQIDNNRDHYDLISAEGKDFIILYLGWLIDQQSYDWANSVLAQYPTRNAIIATHEYISPNTNGAYAGDGQTIWNNVVSQNSNVFLVVCGHINGTFYNVKTNGSQQVVELVADYQGEPEGGAGYMKLLHFNTSTNQMIIDAYSPYKDDYNYFSNEKETRINVTLQ